MSDKKNSIITSLIENKKAFFDYEILKDFECGVKLFGHEVKSIRAKHFHMKAAFVIIREGQVFLQKMNITPYKMVGNKTGINPEREINLFLKKREIEYLSSKIKEKGLSIVPVSVYLKGNLIKVKIALVKGKKQYQKKETIKNRDIEMDLRKSLKEY